MTTLDDARRDLREVFGFDDFLEGQAAVLGRLLAGRSTVAIFPTGGGKSLCYQLPALRLDGLTVVVSPLIALMKDQVDFLIGRGVAAARLDSSLGLDEAQRVRRDLSEGRLRILYVAPERLASERFVATLQGRSIGLLAVDEAHCISEWGHNFRPEYLKLARLSRRLDVGRVLALTATATPEVARDIARGFSIADDDVIRTSFHRPNLELHATPCRADDRDGLLVQRLRERPPGPAIVYVTLQRTAEEVAAFLNQHGFEAAPYHAGLADEVRHATQDRFMASPSLIVVATIAFGMGIDKADIRSVFHYNLPKGPENYAQEIGRAGRDGRLARCELFACDADRVTLENFAHGDTPTTESIASLLKDVLSRGATFDVSIIELANQHDIRPVVVQTLLTYLELEDVIVETGSFAVEYKLEWLRPFSEVLTRFDARRAQFLRNVFARGRPGKRWITLDVAAIAEALGEPRDRIIRAISYLEEQGEANLQVSGLRQGYRRVGDTVDRAKLTQSLAQRFEQREAREIARIESLLKFASRDACLTRGLLAYFGETLEQPCGHCGRCLGEAAQPLPPLQDRTPGRLERALMETVRAEAHEALANPRQLAKFLCGLSSPATVRAKLTKQPAFGALAEFRFARVLELTAIDPGSASRNRPSPDADDGPT